MAKIEQRSHFKYLGAVITDQGFKPEVLSRITQTTVALLKLKTIWVVCSCLERRES